MLPPTHTYPTKTQLHYPAVSVPVSPSGPYVHCPGPHSTLLHSVCFLLPQHLTTQQGKEEVGSVGKLSATCIRLAETQCSKTLANKCNTSESTLHKPRTAPGTGTAQHVGVGGPGVGPDDSGGLGGCSAGSRLGAGIGGLQGGSAPLLGLLEVRQFSAEKASVSRCPHCVDGEVCCGGHNGTTH
ncbi:hypothetical protein E2C01_030355 [Portunus trituberculatus]|uniref:Uncharacterized protein n=1 Tax=Portunus trituberculatus TaxID=210409 RepID=A0A5B7EUM7_PORTR|nr:hypothetical protein [Portunus trituberculatus]